MQVKIFLGSVISMETLEKNINEFLKRLPLADIVKTEVVAFRLLGEAIRDGVAVFVWLRCDAK